MDLILKGDQGVAINPDYLYIKSFEEEGKAFYSIRACFNDGDNWVRLTKNYDFYDSVLEAYKTIYQEAIDLAFEYKETKSNGPIKLEDINIKIRDFEEEK